MDVNNRSYVSCNIFKLKFDYCSFMHLKYSFLLCDSQQTTIDCQRYDKKVSIALTRNQYNFYPVTKNFNTAAGDLNHPTMILRSKRASK